jgi:hypothetical protein
MLENPLTKDGVDYVREAIIEALTIRKDRHGKEVVALWADYYARDYGITLASLLRNGRKD